MNDQTTMTPEEQEKYDKALQEIDQLAKIADEDLEPRILLVRGRILILKDARAEAKKTLSQLIEKHGATPEAQKARSMQTLLN